jgi:hypothetical protein
VRSKEGQYRRRKLDEKIWQLFVREVRMPELYRTVKFSLVTPRYTFYHMPAFTFVVSVELSGGEIEGKIFHARHTLLFIASDHYLLSSVLGLRTRKSQFSRHSDYVLVGNHLHRCHMVLLAFNYI